jgi:N-acetylmuramoyl-L-alanine amidase
MALCPFATFKKITGSATSMTGGPYKIVHHTTEGSRAQAAFDAFKANRSDPHFTVDANDIFQHIDTDFSGMALRNPAGGVQTNRDSAVQIEVVGFANRPKTRATLENVRRLCRWIEETHGVPKVWPNGFPKPATSAGKDPGGHNRNAATWDSKGGHYGHSNVPENIHWDPAYTEDEVNFIMDSSRGPMAMDAYRSIPTEDPGLADAVSSMPDHGSPNAKPAARSLKAPAKKAKKKPAGAARSKPPTAATPKPKKKPSAAAKPKARKKAAKKK